jgi:hypothetical protein
MQRTAGKVRISIKDDENGQYSLLITGDTDNSVQLVWRLGEIGVKARSMGRIIVASGQVASGAGGYAEFGKDCAHQTPQDAVRHAVHSLCDIFRAHDVAVEVGEESAAKAFAPQAGVFESFTFGSGLA